MTNFVLVWPNVNLLVLLQLSKQLDSFRSYLEEFAQSHKDDIRRSPEFRFQFQEMCASIGVDPLACKSSIAVPTGPLVYAAIISLWVR